MEKSVVLLMILIIACSGEPQSQSVTQAPKDDHNHDHDHSNGEDHSGHSHGDHVHPPVPSAPSRLQSSPLELDESLNQAVHVKDVLLNEGAQVGQVYTHRQLLKLLHRIHNQDRR